MDAAAAQLATNNATAALDEESGQNYAEWSVSNKLYKVWLDFVSVFLRHAYADQKTHNRR